MVTKEGTAASVLKAICGELSEVQYQAVGQVGGLQAPTARAVLAENCMSAIMCP